MAVIHISPRNSALTEDQFTNSRGGIGSFPPYRRGLAGKGTVRVRPWCLPARASRDAPQPRPSPRWRASGPPRILLPGPHGLAVRTPAFHAGDRRFESGWGYSRKSPLATELSVLARSPPGR